MLYHAAARRGTTFSRLSTPAQAAVPPHERVGAIENLPAAPPRDRENLERRHPYTAAALFSLSESWLKTSQNAVADLGVSLDRLPEVGAIIPGAMRGLVCERQLGSYADLGMARRSMAHALVAYLEQYR